MIRLLLTGTILAVVIIAGLLTVCGLGNGGFLSAIWDSLSYTVNAEIPASGDGSTGYLILITIGAVIGLLFTSALIGIISSAIEDRLTLLRRGNSLVLESNHIVILGFRPGEYTLISQLVLANEGKSACLLIAEAMERDEMERLLRENISVPGNIKIICRNVDIGDPTSLKICSIPTCQTVVINVMEDNRVQKALLAVSAVLSREPAKGHPIHLVATVSKKQALLPEQAMDCGRRIMLQTDNMIARIISHACTQPGLSEAFLDVFNFEGSELYFYNMPEAVGKQFGELVGRLDGAVPIGISRKRRILLNPSPVEIIRGEDTLLLFAESDTSANLTTARVEAASYQSMEKRPLPERTGKVVLIGCNEVVDTLLRELPEAIRDVLIAGIDEPTWNALQSTYLHSKRDLTLFSEDISQPEALEALVCHANYVVLLSDSKLDDEAADMKSIQLLLRLREIKRKLNLHFTITAEMRRESNHNLVAGGDPTDFIIASDMSSMVLAQLAKTPKLYPVFQELLSNEGNEFYLKSAAAFDCVGMEMCVRSLRLKLLSYGYILLGYLNEDSGMRKAHINPGLNETVSLGERDSLIVLGVQ